MKKNRVAVFLMLALLVITGATPVVAVAEEDDDVFMLEEITVTSEKREASLQKTSMTITAVTGQEIRETGMVTAADVLKDIPNVIVQGAQKGFVIAMRGLGSDLPPSTGESSVSTNFDGVYNARAEAGILGFYDLERVEVLRGPQGTLYGRNATAGVLNVISKAPGDEIEGYASVELGNYSLMRFEGAVTVPVSDTLSTRVAYANINRDGFESNGTDDAVGEGIRAKVRYQPSDDFKADFEVEYTKLGGKGIGNIPEATYYDDPLYNPTSELANRHFEGTRYIANVELNAGPGVLSFIPAYQTAEGYSWSDAGFGISKTLEPLDNEQISSELRYASRSEATVQWVAGLYYYYSTAGMINEHAPIQTETWTKSYAAFGQATYPVSDSLRLVAGLRGAIDKKGYENENLAPYPTEQENDWSAFDWKMGLEYDMSEAVLGYMTLSTGHRPGGFNDRSYTPSLFDPEELISMEAGFKSRFLDSRLQVNTSVFYYDYSDYQVSDSWLSDAGDEMISEIVNVEDSTVYGSELEIEALLGNYTLFNLGVSYLHARYNCDVYLHTDSGATATPMDGVSLPHAPDWSLKGGIEHTLLLGSAGSLTPRVDVRWEDEQYIAPYPGEAQTQEAYSIVDMSLKYAPVGDQWSLTAYVRNLTDEVTKLGYFGDIFLVSSPRQYGVVYNVKF
jgi:iron complex outermembrane receptor protein